MSEPRINDPERMMTAILSVATREFSGKSLHEARIDDVAAATSSSKRMIYYSIPTPLAQ